MPHRIHVLLICVAVFMSGCATSHSSAPEEKKDLVVFRILDQTCEEYRGHLEPLIAKRNGEIALAQDVKKAISAATAVQGYLDGQSHRDGNLTRYYPYAADFLAWGLCESYPTVKLRTMLSEMHRSNLLEPANLAAAKIDLGGLEVDQFYYDESLRTQSPIDTPCLRLQQFELADRMLGYDRVLNRDHKRETLELVDQAFHTTMYILAFVAGMQTSSDEQGNIVYVSPSPYGPPIRTDGQGSQFLSNLENLCLQNERNSIRQATVWLLENNHRAPALF